MPRNGFFGVKNSHIATFKDEGTFMFNKPVHIPGTVEIKMDRSIETATSYADNEVWLESKQDNGGSGTISFYDTESTPELRELFAELVGFDIDADGHVLETSGKDPKPFAYMAEQPGKVVGKRRCWYKCTLTPPSLDAKTLEEKPDITQLDYGIKWVPVTLPTGWRGCSYTSYSDLDDYENFFDAVKTDLTPKAGE